MTMRSNGNSKIIGAAAAPIAAPLHCPHETPAEVVAKIIYLQTRKACLAGPRPPLS